MKRLAGNNWEDNLQELLLVVSEKDEEYLLRIQPYFNAWCVNVVRNMNGKRGVMAKYRSQYVDQKELDAVSYEWEKRYSIEIVEEDLKKLTWYERKLFLAYVEEGTLRDLSASTKIPLTSVHNTVKQVKEKLRCSQSRY
jgi:DNA-directed RNA polymerase specialized sigma24 family protein